MMVSIPRLDEVCEEELHVARFVAAESESGSIIAFYEQGRDGIDVSTHRLGDCGTKPRHLLERRVLVRQLDAWQLVDAV